VQTTVKKQGTKGIAITNPAVAGEIKKTGDALVAGTIGCYIRLTINNANTLSFWLLGDTKGAGSIEFRSDGHIYGEQSGGSDVDLGAYSINTWYWCQIEWRTAPANQVRYKIDAGDWSDWQGAYQAWTTNPNIVRFYAYDGTYSAYIDYISGTAPVVYTLVAEVGSFILTGIAAILTRTGLLWTNQAKSSTISPTNQTKHSISPTNQSKNSAANIVNQSKT